MKRKGFHFNDSYTKLPNIFYTICNPDSDLSPSLVYYNKQLDQKLGLGLANLADRKKAELLSGKCLPRNAKPYSQAYAGHQFGGFTVLGDGRAHILGEHLTVDNERYDIQLKGSGRTVYSRGGDGKAPLESILREYIISEAMHHLGVPTTRSLAVVRTGELIKRYDWLPGAILTRVASSLIRIGTFEWAALQADKNSLDALLQYTIQRHNIDVRPGSNKALALLEMVMHRQIDLMVHWMRVGFIHGVMNTDNTSICGETIDYGPCAFMNVYNPDTVFSSIDNQGRYAFGRQPNIARWNLAKLAETLIPYIHNDTDIAVEQAGRIINSFQASYEEKWLLMMRSKLGLVGQDKDDKMLISDLLAWMYTNQSDYTNTFLQLTKNQKPAGNGLEERSFDKWYQRWQARLNKNGGSTTEAIRIMRATNPAVIPRNHLVERGIKQALAGDYTHIDDLMEVLQKPYNPSICAQEYQHPPKPDEDVYQTFCGT